MNFTPSSLAGLVIAASFAAGLNIYATLLTLGLLARVRWIDLPPGLDILHGWWIIGISAVLFALGFLMDKLPGIDLVWNALHTFVRLPIAALLAYRATLQLSPAEQVMATTAGALIALAAHSSKIATRTLVTASPEPLSNIALSTGEDAVAVGLSWSAAKHPWIAGSVAATLSLAAIFMIRWTSLSLSRGWRRLRHSR